MRINDFFRGVVWKRDDRKAPDGRTIYRYTVVGILVTDEPIDGLPGSIELPSETVLSGFTALLAEALGSIRKAKAKIRFGDATDVLLSLGDNVEEEGTDE